MKKPDLDETNIATGSTSNSDQTAHTTQPTASTEAASTKSAANSDALATAEAKITELTSDLQRTRADFENFRKQVEAQRSQSMALAAQATVEKLLPLVDDFDRALSTYPNQLAPLEKNLTKTLQSLKLEEIISTEGTEFNPDLHEAVSVEDAGGDSEVIAETLRAGYLYDGAVIRAAMVKVKRV